MVTLSCRPCRPFLFVFFLDHSLSTKRKTKHILITFLSTTFFHSFHHLRKKNPRSFPKELETQRFQLEESMKVLSHKVPLRLGWNRGWTKTMEYIGIQYLLKGFLRVFFLGIPMDCPWDFLFSGSWGSCWTPKLDETMV